VSDDFSIKKVYILTAVFGVLGAAAYLWAEGIRSAAAFLLGAIASCGNLWLFDWVSKSISPQAAARKPWQAGAYITRYLVLVGIGYVIVRGLNVSPLAVILGLLASAAAVLVWLILELFSHALRGRTSH
jgi:hypothetical protein